MLLVLYNTFFHKFAGHHFKDYVLLAEYFLKKAKCLLFRRKCCMADSHSEHGKELQVKLFSFSYPPHPPFLRDVKNKYVFEKCLLIKQFECF